MRRLPGQGGAALAGAALALLLLLLLLGRLSRRLCFFLSFLHLLAWASGPGFELAGRANVPSDEAAIKAASVILLISTDTQVESGVSCRQVKPRMAVLDRSPVPHY